MHRRKLFSIFVPLILCALFSPTLLAQSVCDAGNGPLNPAQPSDISTGEIIQKFAAKEAIAKAARAKYSYTQTITIQELTGNGQNVAGELNQVAEVSLNRYGRRVEKPTFAPSEYFADLSITPADMEDIKDRLPFVITTEELPQFQRHLRWSPAGGRASHLRFRYCPKNPKKEKQISVEKSGWMITTW